MEDLILLICRIFGMIVAGFGLWFGAISACFLLREKTLPEPDRLRRFAVLIPARNEEACIAGIIESIQKQECMALHLPSAKIITSFVQFH